MKNRVNGVYLGKKRLSYRTVIGAGLEAVDRNLDAISEFAKANKGIKIHSVFVPNAANICSDKLPFGRLCAPRTRILTI